MTLINLEAWPMDGNFVTPIETASVAVWNHMLEGWPEEVCGLIWDDGSITRLRNQAASQTRFSVGKTQLAEALAAVDPNDKLLAAVYHSHPTGTFVMSHEDKESMLKMWEMISVPWVIVTRQISAGVAYDHLHVWSLNVHKDLYVKESMVRTTEPSYAV